MSDTNEIMEIQKRLEQARTFLRDQAGHYAEALQVRKYDDQRRKQLLAAKMRPFITAGDNVSLARTKALGGDEYAVELDKLAQQYKLAEETVAKYEAAGISFKSAQSLLSYSKMQGNFV